MATYTYPAPPATTADGQTINVHRLLKNPAVLARRVRTLAEQRFIADFLLTGRFQAVGGSILYETGEPVFLDDDPESIPPGGAFPQSKATNGPIATAKTSKWGRDVPVFDETISRLGINPVNRGLLKLVNTVVRYVDSIALGVIASKVTATWDVTGAGAPGAWTTGGPILEGVLRAAAQVDELNQGFSIDTIVLKPSQHAKVIARLVNANMLPREVDGNPVVGGKYPIEALGYTWATSPNVPTTDPLLLDRSQLGGMADEEIDSPGYSRGGAGVGVETKSIRDDKLEGYLLRARRVTVPVVLEPSAAIRLTNTGI